MDHLERKQFNDEQIANIVLTLVGKIEPVGETRTDEERYENLLRLQDVANLLINEIYHICAYSIRMEYSMHHAAECAAEWIRDTEMWLHDLDVMRDDNE